MKNTKAIKALDNNQLRLIKGGNNTTTALSDLEKDDVVTYARHPGIGGGSGGPGGIGG